MRLPKGAWFNAHIRKQPLDGNRNIKFRNQCPKRVWENTFYVKFSICLGASIDRFFASDEFYRKIRLGLATVWHGRIEDGSSRLIRLVLRASGGEFKLRKIDRRVSKAAKSAGSVQALFGLILMNIRQQEVSAQKAYCFLRRH